MKEQLVITLEADGPEGRDPPLELRWRRMLKTVLRQCGLRCRDVRIVSPDQPDRISDRALIAAATLMRDPAAMEALLEDPRVGTREELASDAEPQPS